MAHVSLAGSIEVTASFQEAEKIVPAPVLSSIVWYLGWVWTAHWDAIGDGDYTEESPHHAVQTGNMTHQEETPGGEVLRGWTAHSLVRLSKKDHKDLQKNTVVIIMAISPQDLPEAIPGPWTRELWYCKIASHCCPSEFPHSALWQCRFVILYFRRSKVRYGAIINPLSEPSFFWGFREKNPLSCLGLNIRVIHSPWLTAPSAFKAAVAQQVFLLLCDSLPRLMKHLCNPGSSLHSQVN